MRDPLTALVVDDEPLARQRLTLMLTDFADVAVVGEAPTAAEAARLVRERQPAVVFLDVSMPGGSGFRLFDAVPAGRRPLVVFVTAHPEHAVRAFDVEAVDYLLKPFDDERLAQALDRVRRAREAAGTAALRDEVRALAAAIAPALGQGVGAGAAADGSPTAGAAAPHPVAARPTRFAVTVGRRTVFVPVADLDWVEAERNYVWLHAGGQRYLHRCGIGQMEVLLDPATFARVHRSAIVRVAGVRELRTPAAGGEALAVLRDGTAVPVSARHRARLERA